MRIDKGTYFTFGLAVVCLLLTIVAIGAQANDTLTPQPEPVISEISVTAGDDPAQQLITRQLDAIRARNADLAWSTTTDTFHEKFDTAKEFLSHLRFQLRPIYNHKGYKFLDQSHSENDLIQKVEMEDRYGKPVTVIYRLEQQDGQWLIDSFAILSLEAQPI